MMTRLQPWLEDGYWVIVDGVSDASRRTSHECLSFTQQPAGRPGNIKDHVRNIDIFMDGWRRMCLRHISNGYKVYLVDGHTPKEAKQLALGAIDSAFKWSGPALDAKKADWPSTKDPPTPEDEFFEWIANAGFPRELIRQSFDLPTIRKQFESAFQQHLDQEEKEAQQELLVELRVKTAAAEALASEKAESAPIPTAGAEVPSELKPLERRMAEIAKKVRTLEAEIKAIRGDEVRTSFTKDDLQWWKDNRPKRLILNLGLGDDEIVGHITSGATSREAAVEIVASLEENLKPGTVDDYTRRGGKFIKRL